MLTYTSVDIASTGLLYTFLHLSGEGRKCRYSQLPVRHAIDRCNVGDSLSTGVLYPIQALIYFQDIISTRI